MKLLTVNLSLKDLKSAMLSKALTTKKVVVNFPVLEKPNFQELVTLKMLQIMMTTHTVAMVSITVERLSK